MYGETVTTSNPPIKISVDLPISADGSYGENNALIFPLGQDGELWDGEAWTTI